MNVSITTDFGELTAKLQGAPTRLQAAIDRGLQQSGKKLTSLVGDAINEKFRQRTGALRKAPEWALVDRGELAIFVRDLAYARVQEEGGTIQGKPWLAIPIEETARRFGITTRAGVRVRARDVKANPGQYGFESTFVAKGVIFGVPVDGKTVRGPGGRWNIVPIFALKSSVTIKGKHYLRDTVTNNTQVIIDQIAKELGQVT